MHLGHVKSVFVLLSGVLLSSCVHTALAPVSTPDGVPVVIRVPGVRVGQNPTTAQIGVIDAKVSQDLKKDSAPEKPDPAILGVGSVGRYGEVTTKRGEKFVGYMPFVVVRSTYPPEVVERAAGMAAAAYYRSAKKHFQVVPLTDLKTKPKQVKR